VHAPQIAGVTAVAAAERSRRPFEDDDARTAFRRRQRRSKRSVPATQNRYVILIIDERQ